MSYPLKSDTNKRCLDTKLDSIKWAARTLSLYIQIPKNNVLCPSTNKVFKTSKRTPSMCVLVIIQELFARKNFKVCLAIFHIFSSRKWQNWAAYLSVFELSDKSISKKDFEVNNIDITTMEKISFHWLYFQLWPSPVNVIIIALKSCIFIVKGDDNCIELDWQISYVCN